MSFQIYCLCGSSCSSYTLINVSKHEHSEVLVGTITIILTMVKNNLEELGNCKAIVFVHLSFYDDLQFLDEVQVRPVSRLVFKEHHKLSHCLTDLAM